MSDDNAAARIRSSSLPHRGLSTKSRQFVPLAHNRTTVRVDRANAHALRIAERDLRRVQQEIRRPVFKAAMLNQVKDYRSVKRVNVSV